MKRLLSLITLFVVAVCCYAEQKTYVVDGFRYMADPDTKEATLLYNEDKYKGDVVILLVFFYGRRKSVTFASVKTKAILPCAPPLPLPACLWRSWGDGRH